MAVTNLVKEQDDDHAKRIAEFAIDAIAAANETLVDPENEDKGHVNIRGGKSAPLEIPPIVVRLMLRSDAMFLVSRFPLGSRRCRRSWHPQPSILSLW
jgi:hypothetical protein